MSVANTDHGKDHIITQVGADLKRLCGPTFCGKGSQGKIIWHPV